MTPPALTLVKYPYHVDPDISAQLDQAVAEWCDQCGEGTPATHGGLLCDQCRPTKWLLRLVRP